MRKYIMESTFKEYGKEISIPLIELRLAISLKEPIKDRKPKDTSLEDTMNQIKTNLEKINTLAIKTMKEAAEEALPSLFYKRTKKIVSKTKIAIEKIELCDNLLEKRKTLRSSKSIEKVKNQTLEEFQNLYDSIKKISLIIG
jgi:uncharacterized membrane-anchored protein YjiN (DUF445 family)